MSRLPVLMLPGPGERHDCVNASDCLRAAVPMNWARAHCPTACPSLVPVERWMRVEQNANGHGFSAIAAFQDQDESDDGPPTRERDVRGRVLPTGTSALVVAAIRSGCHSPSAIARHARLSEPNVCRILLELTAAGTVQRQRRGFYSLREAA